MLVIGFPVRVCRYNKTAMVYMDCFLWRLHLDLIRWSTLNIENQSIVQLHSSYFVFGWCLFSFLNESIGFCHSLVDFRSPFCAYPRSLSLTPAPIHTYFHSLPRLSMPVRAHSCPLPPTPACADLRISTGEWQKPINVQNICHVCDSMAHKLHALLAHCQIQSSSKLPTWFHPISQWHILILAH